MKIAVLIATILLSYVAARHPIDFPVYRAATRAMLTGTGPLYGPGSGMGWPQIYRYPPFFLLLFVPFALLPLKLGAIVWTALKFVTLYYLASALFAKLHLNSSIWMQFLAVLPALPYLALEFHYGNAEFFVFAMVAAALLWMEKRPVQAALILALGISIKVWPLFFLPYLAARRRMRVAVLAFAFTVGFTLVPAGYFGWRGNAALLSQWATQEFGVAATAGEPGIIGFPSQSLHSMMMRYLVSLDYSKLTDPNYPKLNLVALDPHAVELIWAILAASGYAGLLLLARRQADSDDLTVHGVAFCGLALLEPFTQSGDLVVLLWPIMVAVAALSMAKHLPKWARAMMWISLSIMVFQPLLWTSAMQRFLHVLGVDFAVSCLLGMGLLGKCLQKPIEETTVQMPGQAAGIRTATRRV